MPTPYDQIPDRRAILSRRALEEVIAKLVEGSPASGEALRPALLPLLRDALSKGRAEIRRRFEGPGPLHNDGPAVLVATSFLMDQLIRVVFDFANHHAYPAANPSAAERLGLVATGGFGRGELAPLSDLDLLFLRPYKQTPHGEQIVEFMLYLLWDLGLKVGHATRTVDECLRYADRDITIRTALLEARYLWGDRELYDQLTRRGIDVRFAIHPVAGRMPGHMNVLLAEADIPYDKLVEMDAINPDMPQCDLCLVVGANDVVNPAARHDKTSPIYGMPIIDADKAKMCIAIKRTMNPGFAGIENELYYADRTYMLFGDAKQVVGDLVKQLSGGSGMH